MVTGILADVNIEGHVRYLIELVASDEWVEFWTFLGLTYARFADLGLHDDASDAEIWRVCQGKRLRAHYRQQKRRWARLARVDYP